jgi:light-regulated signal transduction histidine kinase (bacteriophytochrome)
MTAMAKSILDDLRVRDPQRKVIVHVQPDVIAVADRGLLHLVMENLLGNAWKFTGKVEAAQIIVGSMIVPRHGAVYFVEDNGAGFDMEFASQLFAPFQRLHDSSEFEGTGVGLATVQRVIHRHAGRIWAQSSPGKGARFCFTLGAAAAPGKK